MRRTACNDDQVCHVLALISDIRIKPPNSENRLLETCMELYNTGAILPIHPIRIFDALAVEDAFRFLQKGTHMGKVVIRFPENPENLPSVPSPRSFGFRPDVSYLLVGGLGGLGQAVATWMAERGAKHLIFLSRSAGVSDAHQEFLNELHAMGCAAQTFAGSVANIEDVKKVVRDADKPIIGVLQMSMVLRVLPPGSLSKS
jgi:NADPH:quinone reductase-like Zn-dependent oxidoreductase